MAEKLPTLKGLLICPADQTITEVDVNPGDDSYLNSMYRLIDCDNVDCVRHYLRPVGSDDDLWVDDEFLLKEKPVMWGFTFYSPEEATPILGNALVLGVDLNTGECKSHDLTPEKIQEVKNKITWCYLVRQ